MKQGKPNVSRMRCSKKTPPLLPQIYKNLDTKNMEARKRPSVAEVELYWKSLWGEKAQDNERADSIRRDERRKISNMDWRPIQIAEITSFS